MPKKEVMKDKVSIPKDSSNKPVNPNKLLLENFVALQKVMTNMSLKFENLATQISKLLELFEISAKALAEKELHSEKGDKNSRKVIEKLDNLLDQNKIIARGVALMHESEPEQFAPPQNIMPQQKFIRPQQPSQFLPRKNNPKPNMEDYEKSLSEKP